MNSWYDMVSNQASPYQQYSGMRFQNPMQKAAYIMQALSNPAAFVRQHIPDLPQNISNNPTAILEYLKQSRGISDQQIQQLAQQNPYPGGY